MARLTDSMSAFGKLSAMTPGRPVAGVDAGAAPAASAEPRMQAAMAGRQRSELPAARLRPCGDGLGKDMDSVWAVVPSATLLRSQLM